MENGALQGLIRQELVSKASFSLQQCFRQLETAQNHENAPGYAAWQTHLESTRDRLVQYIQTPSPALFDAADSDSTVTTNTKRWVADMPALCVWPAIWQAAKALSLQNKRRVTPDDVGQAYPDQINDELSASAAPPFRCLKPMAPSARLLLTLSPCGYSAMRGPCCTRGRQCTSGLLGHIKLRLKASSAYPP